LEVKPLFYVEMSRFKKKEEQNNIRSRTHVCDVCQNKSRPTQRFSEHAAVTEGLQRGDVLQNHMGQSRYILNS